MASTVPNMKDVENKPSVAALKEKATQGIRRAQWLRAAILGANDGLISTASLMLGIGAARSDKGSMIISGIAGALAGACSMAVGEFVSVSTQRDIEKSMIEKSVADVKVQGDHGDIATRQVHATQPTIAESELRAILARAAISITPNKTIEQLEKKNSLSDSEPPGKVSPLVKLIYERERELSSPGLICSANQSVKSSPVAHFFSPSKSSKMIHATSETRLSIVQEDDKELVALPNPYKAAAASALSFLCGALIPIVSTMALSSSRIRFIIIMVVTSISLAAFGGLGAVLGGSPVRVSALRVVLGGWMSMSISYGLLKAFDAADANFQAGMSS